jgi:fructose-bisphosphate aldolase class I
LYDETIRQKDDNNVLFTKILQDNGIVPGIKVDLGQLTIPSTNKELRTIGLDDLDKRCKEYYKLGARFAKWRGQIDIDQKKNFPSKLAISEQCSFLARYAAICQANGIVPIVEPEVILLK